MVIGTTVIPQQWGQHYIFYRGSDSNGDKHHGNTMVIVMDWILSLLMGLYLPARPHVSLNRLHYLSCCWTVQWLWLLMLCFVLCLHVCVVMCLYL